MEDARKALESVAIPGYYDGQNLDAYVKYIEHVDTMERLEAKKGSFAECFKGTNLRRTEIVRSLVWRGSDSQMFGVWLVQVWSGQGITGLTVQL